VRDSGRAALMVSHDPALLAAISDKTVQWHDLADH
jgi:ABC-type glutathione transport system ATPase component